MTFDALIHDGRASLRVGAWAEAEELFRRAGDVAVDEAERAAEIAEGTAMEKYIHYIRGEIARRRGDRGQASEHFRRLQRFYPEMPTLAEILLSMNIAPFLLPE